MAILVTKGVQFTMSRSSYFCIHMIEVLRLMWALLQNGNMCTFLLVPLNFILFLY